MKQNKNNRFAALLLALCMAVCCALPALAAPAASANIDLSRTGSMDVTLYDHQNDVPLRGGALTVYKVADVARTNGDLHFVYTADFTGCGIALGDLTDSTLASRLEAKLPARAAGGRWLEEGRRKEAISDSTRRASHPGRGCWLPDRRDRQNHCWADKSQRPGLGWRYLGSRGAGRKRPGSGLSQCR